MDDTFSEFRHVDPIKFRDLVADECETHLILSPFFMHIWNLNVQFNEKLCNLHPYFCFAEFIAKETKKKQEKQQIWPKTRKATYWTKAGKSECHDNFHQCRNKTQGV